MLLYIILRLLFKPLSCLNIFADFSSPFRTLAFYPHVLHPLRHRLLFDFHPSNRFHRTLLLQTPRRYHRPRYYWRQCRRHYLSSDAPASLSPSRLQMGNANPRVPLPLPPLHCQPAHPQSSTTVQRQQRRPEHLARLAHLQEPSLRIDDRGGLLH